jgi:pyruvate/2-oxoglutarate dehydrogenase complex dihydrolipoamide acyltransferase (E2) component
MRRIAFFKDGVLKKILVGNDAVIALNAEAGGFDAYEAPEDLLVTDTGVNPEELTPFSISEP